MRFFYVLLLILLSASSVFGGTDYWAIDIPVLQSGSNVRIEKLDRFSTIIKSYDICVESIETVAKFYDEFFKSLDWENSFRAASTAHDKQTESLWSARRLTFNDEGKPEAIYASSWKAKELPAKGSLQLTLTNYSEKGFEGHIKVVISPDIDMSPLIKINRLIGNNPKNLFRLYKSVKGNPFKIETITIPSSPKSEKDGLVKEYYKLVNQIMNSYSDFHNKYVKHELGAKPD